MLKICPKCGSRKRELNAFCTSCKPTLGSIKAKAYKAEDKANKANRMNVLNTVYGRDTTNAVASTKNPAETKVKIKIIAQVKEAKIKTEWSDCQCKKCSHKINYPVGSYIPTSCHFCRLREVIGISGLLTDFLCHENKLERSHRTNYEEKLLLANRKPLRERIKSILALYGLSTEELINACAIDKEVRTIVYDMNRGQQRNKKRSNAYPTLPKNIVPFYQGGAPGLGKGS